MRTEMRKGIFGQPEEVRVEENGHSASNSSGCACTECRQLRAADGRCPECGRSMKGAGFLDRCVACTGNGLGC